MTQPTDGDNLKTCVTEDGSINLSCLFVRSMLTVEAGGTYRDFLLRQHNCAVLSPHPNGGNVGCGNGLERIFCGQGD